MFDSANNNVNVISPIFYRYSITCSSQVFKLNCKKSVIALYRLHFAQRELSSFPPLPTSKPPTSILRGMAVWLAERCTILGSKSKSIIFELEVCGSYEGVSWSNEIAELNVSR
ncbi:hypothetical protein PV325_001072 [Microctonus aethiopoides]|nr:hypothetical protein PV325_001072 [Microctonus aethiopoides]